MGGHEMKKTFVLMHGAWHGGWCWQQVAEILRGRGHRVTAPTQTGLGERRHLLSDDLTLQTYIDDLVNHVLAEDLSNVTLVGHSFGGNAVSGAAEAIPDRIRDLVYLDSTILMGGDTLLDKLPPGKLAERIASIKTGDIAVPPPDASAFGVLDADQAAWVQSRLTPHPISTMRSPLPIKRLPGNGLPTRYIACMEPQYHPPGRVDAWVAPMGWRVEELQTGHDAMVTAPQALAELLTK